MFVVPSQDNVLPF